MTCIWGKVGKSILVLFLLNRHVIFFLKCSTSNRNGNTGECEWPNNKTLHYRFTDELQVVLLSHIRETHSDKIMFGKHISIWSWGFFFEQVLLICILNKDKTKKNPNKRENQTTAFCVKKIYTVTAFKGLHAFYCLKGK